MSGCFQIQVTEKNAIVGSYLPGRQKFGVEIPGSEFECPPIVVFEDIRIFTVLRLGPLHPGGTVVVCGNGQGPAAQLFIVFLEQPRCGPGRGNGIPAFVEDIVHRQEALARGAGELPYPGSTEFAVSLGIERRFHMGQIGQIRRHPMGFQNGPHPVQIGSGADQTGLKAVPLTDLAAYPVTGLCKRSGTGSRTEQRGHPAAFGVFRIRIGGQPFQYGGNLTAGLLHAFTVAFAGSRLVHRFKVDHPIDDIETVAVMHHRLGGRITGIDICPKRHIGFDDRVLGKRIRSGLHRCNGQAENRQCNHKPDKRMLVQHG